MKYFLIAGEASGDLHASNLIRSLRERDPQGVFVGMGGEKMREAGCRLVQDCREMAFMGIVAVLKNLGKVHRNFRIAHEALLQEKPDVVILIDYPSFNLRMAKWCKQHLLQTKVVYYIPPKVWAWKSWRVHKIARYTDLVLGIFPFEPSFYARYGYDCQYVGNPTIDSIQVALQKKSGVTYTHPIIALLPGSRKSEISHCLPDMLEAARQVQTSHPDLEIVVTAAPGVEDAYYRCLMGETDGIQLTRDTYSVMRQAKAAVVNSGTATLETALFGCPMVAVYYIATSRFFGKRVVDFFKHYLFHDGYFTLVNILLGKEAVKELIAEQFTATNITDELTRLLDDSSYRDAQAADFHQLADILGTTPAAQTAAEAIMKVCV
ncbi:MAG: lipid-A-disaccharide synthase [Paludibacteraceae bacterium]|nr:lipid-A-disaccharide synthase [Paludibacteraceae bacterium]